MGRALVPGLPSPHPLGRSLPALYQQDEFAQRLTAALDEVVAPLFACLDSQEAYLDPHLAPEDFLHWLAGWVGLALDEEWPIERRRALVAEAAQLYRVRGTASGLRAHLELLTGGTVEIEESGGAGWSTTADTPMPGQPGFTLLARVSVDDPAHVSPARLDALVATAKPAHVVHRVEVVGSNAAGKDQGNYRG
jgi:phage tail-like protein